MKLSCSKKFYTAFLFLLLIITCFPVTAYADVSGESSITFQVGLKWTQKYSDDWWAAPPGLHPDSTLPQGVSFEQECEEQSYITGTVVPGTVGGSYVAWVTGSDEHRLTVSITVVKGSQTIVCSDQTVLLGDTLTLEPYSIDGNGTKIDVATMNTDHFMTDGIYDDDLIAAHQPAYTFGGGNDNIAMIDPVTGVVSLIGEGQTTFTIDSDTTESYLEAEQKIVRITVDVPLATLKTVLSQTITNGGEAGTSTEPKFAEITVSNGVSILTAADIESNQDNETIEFGTELNALGTTDLPLNMGTNTIYIAITAEDGLTKMYFIVNITREGYTITFNSNGGTVMPESLKTDADGKLSVAIPTPTRNGYRFLAWWTEQDGGVEVDEYTEFEDNTEIWARWTRNSSGGGGSTPTQPTTKIDGVDINYSIDKNGVVTLKPTPHQLDKLLKTIGDDGVLNISVSGITNMKSAIIEIALTKLIASDKLQVFVFNVLGHEVRFPVGALESMQKLAKTLRFGVAPGSIVFELTEANGNAIQNLARLGLVKGNDDGSLNPNGDSTRSEGAQFLYNILKYDAK